MINNVVGISGSVTAPSLRTSVQAAPTPEAPTRAPGGSQTSSRIRVDNFLDLAILEVRSQETGDVIRQFPNERQIAAFQRAEELSARRAAAAAEARVAVSDTPDTSASNITVNVDTSVSAPSAPSAPTESVSATPAPSSGASTDTGTSTQSVLV